MSPGLLAEGWEELIVVPKAFPREFREDCVRLARSGAAPVTQVAKDMGVSESCLRRWMAADVTADATTPAEAAQVNAEVVRWRKRAMLLEQENEVLRRATAYLSRDLLPK